MAKKFKINDRVRIKATGDVGTVKGREVLPIEGSKRVNIEYVVKLGDGFSNWKPFSKTELEPIRKEVNERRVYTKVYDVVDGYKITMYTKVDIDKFCILGKEYKLRMGYAIYSPEDVYVYDRGVRIARKRSRTSPFCHIESSFSGEFNEATVNALMDVKADYIKNNLDKFIKRENKD